MNKAHSDWVWVRSTKEGLRWGWGQRDESSEKGLPLRPRSA